MNSVFTEYNTLEGFNSPQGTIKVLIAPTSEDNSKVRFNIVQMVDGESVANVCALLSVETAELFVHHLNSACVNKITDCGCGGTLEVL